MSCITENTIVIKREDKKQFLKDVAKFSDIYRIRGLKHTFENREISIYTFDCNGDNPWSIDNTQIAPIINETSYGDGSPVNTEVQREDGTIQDSHFHCIYHLKKMFPDSNLPIDRISELIKYS